MIIKSLSLKEGMDNCIDVYSPNRNLIFSNKNTKGKTTYLRLLFYSLGYPIPNMRGIDFNKVETTILLEDKGEEILVERNIDLLKITKGKEYIYYTLPSEHMAFLSYLFQYDNIKVLNNILGIIYIDQDKGWSLLNRGTVVGKIKFSIEELLSGLNGVSIDELIEEKRNLEYTKKKYEALLNIQELSEQVYEKNGEIFITDVEKEYSERIAFLNLKLSDLKRSLKEINEIINKEKNFFAYIDAMNLSVKSGDIEIPVNRDTLVNAPETMELFKARRSIIVTDIEKINREKAKYELVLKERDLKKFQTSLYDSDDTDVIINKKLAELSFSDQDVVSNLLEKTKSDLKGINNRIKEAVKKDNKYISKIYNYVYEYAKRLEIEEKMVLKEDFIFTSDLKSLSGAVLQKMVFAFKIAFLKVIEDDIGTNLFFVMDSPKNKELDDYNTELIMNLIKDELNSNQVFIASIYEFDNENKIEIKTKAIDRRN